ncbi:cyclase family protein [Streptomyces prasinopilosus]|nr:cyclase family protein [Streptomyces prasinopilosus]
MRIIDISSAVDASGWEPDEVRHEVLSPRDGAVHMSEEMRRHFGVEFDPDELPDGEFLSLDRLTLTSHTGTHIDAPSHYGSRAHYGDGRPRNIDELPLDWFYGPGLLLDLTGCEGPTAGAGDLEKELARIGRVPEPGTIVLLRTGAFERVGTERYFTDFTGLDGPAVNLLLDHGVRVIGTDAFSLDAPFGAVIRRYRETGDRSVLWPAHVTGRQREYCQIERLGNLAALPGCDGFHVACFPVKIAGAGAGWARAVAFVDE